MPFLKKVEIRDLSSKYGKTHRGIVALEAIKAGEIAFQCDLSICNYFTLDDPRNKMSKDEVLALIEEYPESADYLRYYSYMIDDDLFDVPRYYTTREVKEGCVLINHSCEGNCGYGDEEQHSIIAIRDIAEGEELTYHYGLMDSEDSLWTGLVCRCGSKNCAGILKFDFWRDPKWQEKYEPYAGAYIKRKIRKLREQQQLSAISY